MDFWKVCGDCKFYVPINCRNGIMSDTSLYSHEKDYLKCGLGCPAKNSDCRSQPYCNCSKSKHYYVFEVKATSRSCKFYEIKD